MGAGDEDLPEAVAAHAHRMTPPVPEIEFADHADPLGIRREHHEGDACNVFHDDRMRTELVVGAQMRSFAEQMQVIVRKHRREAVGVLEFDLAAVPLRLEPVAALRRPRASKQAGLIDAP